jgi:uncharacterized protein
LGDLAAILGRLTADGVVGEALDLCWHAGEPLVAGLDFYREAQRVIREILPAGIRLTQVMQTNGTLIDERWCELFREYNIRVGLSLDGPREVHDRNRVTRRGGGTHDQVIRALGLLKSAGVLPYALCVVDRAGLASPQALYDYFAGLGFEEVCFNIEETDGVNVSSAVAMGDLRAAGHEFFAPLLRSAQGPQPRPWVRELHRMLGSIAMATQDSGAPLGSDLTEPFGIITVAHDGRWSTFSPELSGVKSVAHDDFFFGNLVHESLDVGVARPVFQRLYAEISAGVAQCRAECGYFRVCGGGSPSNKFAETGRFDTTETGYCRSWTQGLADACLDFIEGAMSAEPRA